MIKLFVCGVESVVKFAANRTRLAYFEVFKGSCNKPISFESDKMKYEKEYQIFVFCAD